MIARATGRPVSITGLGWYVPDKVVTNDELAKVVDTSDEWIMTRTGIRERRMVEDDVAMSDISLPAARAPWSASGALASRAGRSIFTSSGPCAVRTAASFTHPPTLCASPASGAGFGRRASTSFRSFGTCFAAT